MLSRRLRSRRPGNTPHCQRCCRSPSPAHREAVLVRHLLFDGRTRGGVNTVDVTTLRRRLPADHSLTHFNRNRIRLRFPRIAQSNGIQTRRCWRSQRQTRHLTIKSTLMACDGVSTDFLLTRPQHRFTILTSLRPAVGVCDAGELKVFRISTFAGSELMEHHKFGPQTTPRRLRPL